MIYCAPYIIPVDSEPFSDGAILVEQNQIVAIGPKQSICSTYPSQPVTEFPHHALMPGLVNCHTHLELSCLANKVPPGLDFADWLRRVIELRSLCEETEAISSIEQGVERLIATGTTCVGDISNTGLSMQAIEKAGLRGIVFLETIGFRSEEADFILAQLETKLIELISDEGLVQMGIGLHAPYSVSPSLFQQVSQLIAACPDVAYRVSVHLAESREEDLFLADGSGPLYRLLEWRGKWDDGWQPPGCSPVQYLDQLQVLSPNLLAVHLNQLQPEDYSLLAKRQVQAVTCPNSNAWLGHKNTHLQTLCQHGINLALGSDSLASNKDINLFYEMRTLAKDNPWLDCDKIIEIATMGGAKALGMEKQIGSLVPGKQADIIAVKAPDDLDINKLAEYVVQEMNQVEMAMIAGKLVLADKKFPV